MNHTPQPQFVVFQDSRAQWWWKIRDAANRNETLCIANSPCGSMDSALAMCQRIKDAGEIVILTDKKEPDTRA